MKVQNSRRAAHARWPTANCWAGLLACVYSWFPAGSPWRVWLQYIVDSECRYTPSVVTSCASKVHRASGPGRGKPALISINFARVSRRNSRIRENPTYISTYTQRWIRGIVCGAIDGPWSEMSSNGQTLWQTHTTTTVTLAALLLWCAIAYSQCVV